MEKPAKTHSAKKFLITRRFQTIQILLAFTFAAMAPKAQAGVTVANLHSFGVFTNGSFPTAPLVQGLDGDFYSVAEVGGTNGIAGTVFKISSNGVFTLLYSFTGKNDGANPVALALGSDGNFYGTTSSGGTNDFGAVFKITPAGAFTPLYSFTGGNVGQGPEAGLVLGSDGNFYGTTTYGGSTNSSGTVFKITPDGSFTSLYSFTNGIDGAYPEAPLVQGNDGNFYGTAIIGGANDLGTIFKITPAGVFTPLYSFQDGIDAESLISALVQGSDGDFYGTSRTGGASYDGSVFKISSGGSFTRIYSFSGGSDGDQPEAGLVQGSDGYFYGTTLAGGSAPYGNGQGTVFKISATGALTTVYTFTGAPDSARPHATLIQATDGNLYGTTEEGGANSSGTLFKVSPGGSFTLLYSFTDGSDGSNPEAALIQASDGNFYGTTESGGAYDYGAVFKITPNGSLTSLYSFTNGVDGSNPYASLMQGTDGNFYGAAPSGGKYAWGTIFKITSTGVFTSLYSFTDGMDGAYPQCALVQGSDSNFYGTAYFGGTNSLLAPLGYGTVFKMTQDGFLTNIYYFTNGADGSFPYAGLAVGADGYFYGTTSGAATNWGTVFKINTNGNFSLMYAFTGGNDGGVPADALVLGADGNFYGTTEAGGTNNDGTVFQLSPGGSFKSLYSFTGGNDGSNPYAGLVQGADGGLYGATLYGGASGYGVVFKISANGSLIPLHSFTGGIDGGSPFTGLVQGSDGNFYGTTYTGGIVGNGVVFSISPGTSTSSPVSIIANNGSFGFANGEFGFDLAGPMGSNVIVEASTDLRTWIPLQTNSFGAAPLYFSDPQSPAIRHRFYRAVLP